MIDNLLDNCAFTLCTTAIISTQDTDIDGTAVDMAGYEGVVFVMNIIDSSATTDSIIGIIGAGSASSAGTFVDYTTATGAVQFDSTAANDGDDRLLVLDLYNVAERWVRPTVFGSSEVMHGECIGIRYKNRKGIVSQSTATDGVAASANFATPTTA